MAANSCAKLSLGTAQSSAAAVGVGARKSAHKSAMVMSVSWPTPDITGTGLFTMACASCSSLKAHKSSMEPPPLTSNITSTSGLAAKACNACTSWGGASAPCTGEGDTVTGICGTRRSRAVTTSCKAAAAKDVTTPMQRGYKGMARLRSCANKPCTSNLALSCKKASCS